MHRNDLIEMYLESAEKATPGPWFANIDDLIGGYAVGTESGPVSTTVASSYVGSFTSKDDAEFIALARDLGPALAQMIKLYRERAYQHYQTVEQIRARCLVGAADTEDPAVQGIAVDVLALLGELAY